MIYRRTYIFISHSHLDIDDVRVVRNYLESLGGEPILFFLLSQTDENEITRLIEDEIDARIWFLLLDSPNARESKWVKSEMEYARKVGKHNIIEIPLHQCVVDGEIAPGYKEFLKEMYHKFVRLSSIMISYNHNDRVIVDEIKNSLKEYGIMLFDDSDIISGIDWQDEIVSMVKDCACVLNIMSFKDSKYKRYENELRKDFNKETYNVILNYHDPESIALIEYYNGKPFVFDTMNIKSSADELIQWLFEKVK